MTGVCLCRGIYLCGGVYLCRVLGLGPLRPQAHTSKLAVYAETIEVANILKEMLDDIKTRREIIDKVDVEAKKLLDDVTAKMVEWEGKLVALGNAKVYVCIYVGICCIHMCIYLLHVCVCVL